MQEKLTPEDLHSLRSAHEQHSDLRSELADITLMESRMISRRTQLLHDIPISENNLRNIELRIKKDYNADRIDLYTGNIECTECIEKKLNETPVIEDSENVAP